MEVVDRVETQERVEKLTEEQKDDLFTKLIMGKDVVETVDTSRGKFTVKYPKAADIIIIGKLAAARRGHKPPGAFDYETEMINMVASTLDAVVVSGPEWFETAKTANKNFSFLEGPSRGFLMELYGKAHSFREEIESRLDKNGGSADKRVPAEESDDVSVGGGAFGSFSSE
ncbi:MAG: hypothetical protein LBQ89_08235 [Treponema sp.]|jgi:hypothetical protein|nr:hypothetical protein [Treponema sp.]